MSEWKPINGIVEVAEAVAAGMEIEVLPIRHWETWQGYMWHKDYKYRARQRKPAKVLVKSICWRSQGGNLTWTSEDYQFYAKDWKRFPVGDLPGEVEE